MRPFIVVPPNPLVTELLGLGWGIEDMGIQHILSESPIESFYKSVLIGLALLDELQFYLLFLSP